MKIHHVVPHIHEEASGPSYSVPALCGALAELGNDVTLHVLQPKKATGDAFKVVDYPQLSMLKRLGISPAMHRGLRAAASQADVLHGHSLWMMPNVYPAWASRGTQCRLVVAPRGTLEPWSLRNSRWRKRVMWTAMQRQAVENAACLHVTAQSECDSIRSLGLQTPVAVIPNGVDIPQLLSNAVRSDGRRRLLYLGRLHPKKGLENLLKAWARVNRKFPDWELRIVGRDQYSHRKTLRQLAASLGLQGVSFSEAVYDTHKSAEYQQADLFVLPTHSENFGIVVAEAMAHGTPVICTKGAPWEQLNQRAAGWWIDIGVDPLVNALEEALSTPNSALQSYGENGSRWMKAEFGWAAVAGKTQRLYQWLVGGGERPEFVDAAARKLQRSIPDGHPVKAA